MIRKTISMPDSMGDWISQRLHAGQYNNESEYFRDLVRRDQQEQEKRDYLLHRLHVGEQQIEAGEYTILETDDDIAELFAGIKAGATQGQ